MITIKDKTLTVIIPVSSRERIETIQHSINAFKFVDFNGFNEKIVYAIDIPDMAMPRLDKLRLEDNTKLLLVTMQKDLDLKQAGAYNAALMKYDNSEYYSFFDLDAHPNIDFFQKCAQVDANFVTGDRYVSNHYQNSITEAVAEEYEFCNSGRRFMYKYIDKYFPASCTGLIQGITLRDFMFTEATSADSELYRHILRNGFSMGYAKTSYVESAPSTKEQLYSQRLRWLSDSWRTCIMTVGSCNTWQINISNMLMYLVGMLPIIGCIALLPYVKHLKGYNFIYHSLYMQYISFIALYNVAMDRDVKWE